MMYSLGSLDTFDCLLLLCRCTGFPSANLSDIQLSRLQEGEASLQHEGHQAILPLNCRLPQYMMLCELVWFLVKIGLARFDLADRNIVFLILV